MKVFINRSLNFNKIKAIGFDQDHTLVRYHETNFEELSHTETIKRLVSHFGYPDKVLDLTFDPKRVIQGLIIDRKLGHLLKISRFGRVKRAYHGDRLLDREEVQSFYNNYSIDLSDKRFTSLDTNFSISQGGIFSQLIELKNKGLSLPEPSLISDNVKEAVDMVHRDGTLKNKVRENIEKYIIQDPPLVGLLKKYKEAGIKLILITNSDLEYSKLLMDYALSPFLEKNEKWNDLFEIIITSAKKPVFFTDNKPFMELSLKSNHKKLYSKKIEKGIFEGGNAAQLQKDLNLNGDEILYVGDHIYGDVVSLKKNFNWRTALVMEPLDNELKAVANGKNYIKEIDNIIIERQKAQENKIDISDFEKQLDQLQKMHHEQFNPHWGELMRARFEESIFAEQVERYACVYMPKVMDLLEYAPCFHFRPLVRKFPHE